MEHSVFQFAACFAVVANLVVGMAEIFHAEEPPMTQATPICETKCNLLPWVTK